MKSSGLLAAVALAAALLGVLAWQLGSDPGASASKPADDSPAAPTPAATTPVDVDRPLSEAPSPAASPTPAADREERGAAAFEAPVRPVGTVVVRAVWKDDGQPARDVFARLYRANSSALFAAIARRTDADGVAKFTRVEAGPVAVRSHSDHVEGVLAKGAVLELTLPVARGVRVEGRLTDGQGRAVSQGLVWLVEETWTELAECDASGRYRIASVPVGARLAATGREHAPSTPVPVPAGRDGLAELDLYVGGPGGTVLGQVLTPAEQPVESAAVFLADVNELSPSAAARGARLSMTDAEGRFEFHGVGAGAVRLVVRSDEFAPLDDEFGIVSGARVERILRVATGAELIGLVTEDGRPLADVSVRVGEFDEDDPTALYSVAVGVSDRQGRYRVTGLAPGAQPVIVKRRSAPTVVAKRGEVAVVAGRAVVWNVELEPEGDD